MKSSEDSSKTVNSNNISVYHFMCGICGLFLLECGHLNKIKFSKDNPEKKFLVTMIACGLAGYHAKEIAPLFKDAINLENVYLPKSFWNIINDIY